MTKWKAVKISESQIQSTAFQHIDILAGYDKRYAKIYAVPNGGKRHLRTAVTLKAEGVKRGVPDINVEVARHGYHGLRIEVKIPGGKPSPEQRQWKVDLEEEGFCHAFCYSTDDILALLKEYFKAQTYEQWLVGYYRHGLERNRSGQVIQG